MNRSQIHQHLQKLAGEEIPPDSIHLWLGVEQILVAKRQNQFEQGNRKMKSTLKSYSRKTWAVVVGLAVVALGVFLFATPQGRVLAQEALNFFTRQNSNEQVAPEMEANLEPQVNNLVATPQEEDVFLEEGCGTLLSPHCNIAEVQADTPFEIQAFSTVPQGMKFAGAVTIPQGVLLKYTGDQGELVLIEKIPDADLESTWTVGKDALIQNTTVRQYPAEYVQGAWSGLGIDRDVLLWDESIPGRTMRWQAGKIEYTLVNLPARGATGPVGYDMDQLRQMAEGLAATTDAGGVQLTDKGISLENAETRAGFKLNESSWIPAGLLLYRTTYDSQHRAICQYYRANSDDPAYPPLVIAQSTWALPTLEELQTKASFNGKAVEIGLTQEVFPIAGADGGQGRFYETGIQIEALCGGEPAVTSRVLLWQKQERTFALFAHLDGFSGGSFVSKFELRRLAEILNSGSSTIEPNTLDPERLLSLKDAEMLTGLNIQQPAVMLAQVRFDHISSGTWMGYPFRVVTQYLGDGRGRLLVFQTPKSQTSLEELRMAGGYSDAVVKGNPAIYRGYCSDSDLYGMGCFQTVSWFEGDTQFDIEAYFPALIKEETFMVIANSMR